MRVRVWSALVMVMGLGCGGISPTTMEFVEITPEQPRIGDIVTVRFRLLDNRGLPLAGTEVDFKLQSPNAAVSLSPATVQSQRGTGFAETQLQASSRVNSVIVVATSGDRTVVSRPITFAGSVPNRSQLTFQCGALAGEGSGGVHAIGVYDQTRTMIAGIQLKCTAHVGDRNGDGIEGALVSFMTEAGTIGPSQISMSNIIGDATVLYKSSLPLPKDVEPENFTWTPLVGDKQTGEYVAPLWMHPFEWVPTPIELPRPPPGASPREPNRMDSVPNRRKPDGTQQRLNPRDNLVTMIAVTSGEEAFQDTNNNGIWDEKNGPEPFEDLTEPFVDSNDNGTWDADERFIDVNNDGEWTGKNNRWDPNTLIWRAERILWTGIPSRWEATGSSPTIGQATNTTPPGPIVFECPQSGVCNQAQPRGGGFFYRLAVIISDPWYNSIAQNGEADGCGTRDAAAVGGAGAPVLVQPFGDGRGGIAFTYPAGQFLELTIRDSRDPTRPPADQTPRRSPISFSVPISCTFTASPESPLETRFTFGAINGTIE